MDLLGPLDEGPAALELLQLHTAEDVDTPMKPRPSSS